MFEREIQFIYDFSHNKIKSLGSFITFSQLKSTELHPAILQYISAEIDFYIFEDRQKLLKDSQKSEQIEEELRRLRKEREQAEKELEELRQMLEEEE